MNGRLYFIPNSVTHNIDIVEEVESIGDGYVTYEYNCERRITSIDNVYEFINRDEYHGCDYAHRCNSLDDFITALWRVYYNIDYKRIYTNMNRFGELFYDDAVPCDDPLEERYYDFDVRSLAGYQCTMFVGDMGDIAFQDAHTRIRITDALSTSKYAYIDVVHGTFFTTLTSHDLPFKPSKGYSRISNAIANYISAFPQGVTINDIKTNLKLGHPTVAGRVSEMADCGRVVKIDAIPRTHGGNSLSVWTLARDD